MPMFSDEHRNRPANLASLRVRVGWRLTSLTVAGVLALAVYVGMTVGENTYVALAASIGVGPLLILPMTRKLVWLVVAAVAGFVLVAALARFVWV